jgi:hypothetical protein
MAMTHLRPTAGADMTKDYLDPFPRPYRGRRTLLSAIAFALLAHASLSHGVTLADPTTFTVKQTWDAMTLGVPTNIAGIRFSSDGSTLYVVGKADTPTSAVYAVPVVRDPNTNEITQLSMASATPFFSANVSTAAGGLDSGPEEGPAGTLFYTYFFANDGNFIGQRRASDFSEMQFDLEPQGVPLYLSGLAFSPYRMDAGTGFGMLQVGTYNGDPDTTPRDVYEVPLTPTGTGFFTPGTATRFLSLVDGSANGLCYAPAGPFAGSLLYASFDAGEVRYIQIDTATGLAVDSQTQTPTLGTTHPVDHLFASDMNVGPVGLDFDPLTTDLFISTYQGTPANSIIQVGGFGTTTTTIAGATTTTTVTASSTTTTLVSGCLGEVTFDAIGCRLDALIAEVQSLSDAGAAGDKLMRKLAGAKSRLQTAATRSAAGHRRGAKGSLGKTIRLVRGFGHVLGSRGAQGIPASVRAMLSTEANDLQADLLALKQSI